MHAPQEKHAATQEQGLMRVGLGLARWSERWFPDPLVFALLGIVVVFAAGLLPPTLFSISGSSRLYAGQRPYNW